MKRSQVQSKARRRARNGTRQILIVLAVGSLVALGGLATGEYVMTKRQTSAAALADAKGSNGQEIYTGSILYVPDRGSNCRQLLFDNRTGRFTDNGYVDCEKAAYRGSKEVPKQWSAARLRVISDGFVQH
jgi:hypothetical protein